MASYGLMEYCAPARLLIRAILTGLLLAGSKAFAGDTPGHGARLRNPFCDVPTFVQRDISTQAQARIDAKGRAVIYIAPDEARGDPAYRDFLMAHECCHHTRGHLQRLRDKRREQAMLDMSFVNRSVELDADCCAGLALARAGRAAAVREAARRMQSYGARPTGAGGYPAGDMRAMLIESCAGGGRVKRAE